MPNLVGLHDPSVDRAELERALNRMLAAVDLPSFNLEQKRAVSEGIACGNILSGIEDNRSQPVRGDGLWLMLDGEILGAKELRRELSRRGTKTEGLDDAGLALAAYKTFGENFVDRLNGTWNLVLHDERQQVTWIATDRIGSRLLFFAEDGPRFTFSSEIKGVIAGRAVKSRAGGSGLLQLLLGTQHFGTATWVEGIELLEPGTIVRLDHSGRERRRYWKYKFNEGAPLVSEDEYAEGFARSLRTATHRAMKDRERLPVAITLSGGLDSRAVALSIDRRYLPISSLTYGDPDSNDVRFAADLAGVIGFDHHYVESERPRLEAESRGALEKILGPSPFGERGFYGLQVDRIIWRSEGLAALYGLASMIWHPLFAKHMRVMLNGACGDAMTGSHLSPKLLVRRSRKQIADDLMNGTLIQNRELVAMVLNPDWLRRFEPSVAPAFRATFDRIEASEPMAIANIWDMENRQRRGAFTSFTMERYFCAPRAPFLDHELIDVLSSVPPMWRFQQRVYKRMLVNCHPHARRVRWAYTGGYISDSPAYEMAREVANYGRHWLEGKLQLKKKQDHWAFRDVVGLLRADRDLFASIERWTQSDSFPSGVFDAAGIQRFLQLFAEGSTPPRAEALFCHLAMLARAERWWLGDRVVEIPPEADPAMFGMTAGARSEAPAELASPA